jgi:PKHD-type hydroxylase
MSLSNYYYWSFPSVLTPRFCDEVIQYASYNKDQEARVGHPSVQYKRKSNIVWLRDEWIYKEVTPYVQEANKKAGWNFDIDFSESFQFTKYKLNQFYDWHCDSFSKPFNKPKDLNIHGKVRKLSVTCQLTDGSEYEGGELQFDFRDYDPPLRDELKHVITAKEILPKGSIIVFPSYIWHRVQPVTKGTRYSLVLWNLGYPFK